MPEELERMPFITSEAIETAQVMKQAARAHRQLAELKGAATTIPNESILIDTLALQEAKDSSEIENIITTQDELYQGDRFASRYPSLSTKEVHNYSAALNLGFERIRSKRFLRLQDVLDIQGALLESRSGIRTLPGTVLKSQTTGEVVYEPPQNREEIESLLSNFLDYFNLDDDSAGIDPLIRMSLLHHQFESIHPFYDGNGRTGRILNLLFLTLHDLLGIPVLYLSRYIVRNKDAYYRLLQTARDENEWEAWTLYLLKAVEETARETLSQVEGIRELMRKTKNELRSKLPKIYSQDLLNNLFRHPYTKIEFIVRDLNVSRPTAMKYLALLDEQGVVEKVKLGRTNFYINHALFSLLTS